MKTYNIEGKEFSEETIAKALKEYCNFKKEHLPIITLCNIDNAKRIIVRLSEGAVSEIVNMGRRVLIFSSDDGVVRNGFADTSHRLPDYYVNRINYGQFS